MVRRFFLLMLFFGSTFGCTRDDICSEDTATTPLLIITFNDIANPTERKSVLNLTVETADNNATKVFTQATTDSIAIPLRNSNNLTAYRFINDDQGSNPNSDVVNLTYTSEDIYVNRACAFKKIYHELNMAVQNEGTANWILQFEILTTDILDETETHITIFH